MGFFNGCFHTLKTMLCCIVVLESLPSDGRCAGLSGTAALARDKLTDAVDLRWTSDSSDGSYKKQHHCAKFLVHYKQTTLSTHWNKPCNGQQLMTTLSTMSSKSCPEGVLRFTLYISDQTFNLPMESRKHWMLPVRITPAKGLVLLHQNAIAFTEHTDRISVRIRSDNKGYRVPTNFVKVIKLFVRLKMKQNYAGQTESFIRTGSYRWCTLMM